VGNSRACKNTYLACFVPASEEVQKLEDEDRENYRMLKSKGWHSSKAFLPMIRVCGPVLPECGTDGAAAMKAKWHNRIPVSGRAFEGLDGYCELSSLGSEQEDEFVPFLMQTNGSRVPGEAGVFQQYGLAAETARLHIKGFIFVHFLSGFRRKEDLQHCMENHNIVGEKHIFCISVDLCLAKQHSDLTDESSKIFWIGKMKSGQILGIGGAKL